MKKKNRFFWMTGIALFAMTVLLGQVQMQKLEGPYQKLINPQVIKALGCSVNVALWPQETGMWCWAASGEMVMEFLQPGLNVRQCDEANYYLSQSDCCNNPTPADCVKGGWEVFAKYGFAFTRRDWNPLSWNDLKAQLCGKRPVMFAWHWDGGGGHMMVVTGWSTSGGENYVHINNPWPPNVGDTQVVTYNAWVDGDGYSHWADFYDIQKKLKIGKIFQLERIKIVPIPPETRFLVMNRPVEEEIRRVASMGLKVLDGLATTENAGAFGFPKKADIQTATLGKPIREFRVRLDDLKNFTKSIELKSIFRGGDKFLYPVVKNKEIFSALRVEKYRQASRLNSMGNASLIRLIAGLAGSEVLSDPAGALSSLEIPALGLYFLSREENGRVQLALVFDEPAYGLKRGVYEDAAAVLGRLQAMAKAMPDEPMGGIR
jgi:hypothetical protein